MQLVPKYSASKDLNNEENIQSKDFSALSIVGHRIIEFAERSEVG